MDSHFHILPLLLSMQQSALDGQSLPLDEKSPRQLLSPHTRSPVQSESKSQSPPPTLHGLEDLQQLQSGLGTPLHASNMK